MIANLSPRRCVSIECESLYIHTYIFINPRSHVTIQDAMKLSYGAFFNVFFKMARLISALSKKVTPYKKGLVDSPNGF